MSCIDFHSNFSSFSLDSRPSTQQPSRMERLTLFNMRQRSRDVEPQTPTIVDQAETEKLVRKAYYERLSTWKDNALRLFKLNHVHYISKRLVQLATSFECLDASQPWLAYWMVHSLRLLNFTISDETKAYLLAFLKSTQHPEGGFGGGPYQFAHLATTYGAINCLAALCWKDALDIIDRPALLHWLQKLRQPDGSFVMHIGGEVDVRGAYCAVAVAKLTGLYPAHPELFSGTADWIASCQTYEGGFGAQPGIEAHGGYTFCAVAALCLLERPNLIDIPRVLRWLAHRQMASEGGFQGRTNKLVDSCYSFWLGALFPVIEELLDLSDDPALLTDETLFNASALQEYILLCCQKVSYTRPGLSIPIPGDAEKGHPELSDSRVEGDGGLIDKPGKNADCYHTCYALSGLSIAQHCPRPRRRQLPAHISNSQPPSFVSIGKPSPAPLVETLCEELDNELADLDPLHNILHDGLGYTLTYFALLDSGKPPEEAAELASKAVENCLTPPRRVITKQCPVPIHDIGSPDHGHSKHTCVTP
ncbi:hypothetical protein CRM22_000049 [Opisthorchis felineus]|uniref:Protein farnesyltransferase subunit beta n=1 Tax=Opisthorchis felineus TaxID=147828 RepID=A0A4S2MN81_OPIFE|nr:hypothetical protein CRM22_000049 [Opisthorchis felineus]